MNHENLLSAVKLAQAVIRREDAQPIPLSTEETVLLARAVLYATSHYDITRNGQTVGNDDPFDLLPFHEAPEHLSYLRHIPRVFHDDTRLTIEADIAYNGSWMQRGGVGAFMMLARKWDRLEQRVKAHGFDVFEAIWKDERREGAIDDIRDLRRYLGLAEAYCVDVNLVRPQQKTKESAT